MARLGDFFKNGKANMYKAFVLMLHNFDNLKLLYFCFVWLYIVFISSLLKHLSIGNLPGAYYWDYFPGVLSLC